jgi:hypothetical protein
MIPPSAHHTRIFHMCIITDGGAEDPEDGGCADHNV